MRQVFDENLTCKKWYIFDVSQWSAHLPKANFSWLMIQRKE